MSTRAWTRLGRDSEATYVISASFPYILEILHILSLSFLNPSRRFRTFGRATIPRPNFALDQNLYAEMNFLAASATCLHCRADIVRTSRLSVRLLFLPQTLLKASAVRRWIYNIALCPHIVREPKRLSESHPDCPSPWFDHSWCNPRCVRAVLLWSEFTMEFLALPIDPKDPPRNVCS